MKPKKKITLLILIIFIISVLTYYSVYTFFVFNVENNPASSPDIAIDNENNIHIVWCDNTNYTGAGMDDDIFYKCWNATSSLWTPLEVITIERNTSSYNPSLAFDGSENIYVVWNDYYENESKYVILYKFKNLITNTWSNSYLLLETSSSPKIRFDQLGNLHLLWIGGYQSDLIYKYGNITSNIWKMNKWITYEKYNDRLDGYNFILDNFNNAHITWSCGTGWDTDIYYTSVKYNSYKLGSIELVSTESSRHSQNPIIDIDYFGNIHVAWMDETNYKGVNEDFDIFYKYKNFITQNWTITEVLSD